MKTRVVEESRSLWKPASVEETPRVSIVVYNYPYRRPMEARVVEESRSLWKPASVEETLYVLPPLLVRSHAARHL